jgi:ornithine decarboxylase
MVQEIMIEKNNIKEILSQLEEQDVSNEDAVLVISKSTLRSRFELLQTLLPACQHYFAIKSCPLPVIIEEWNNFNGHFDIASNGEIDLLNKQQVDLSNCIHSHPIKKQSEIAYAFANGIRTFVVENEAELNKFAMYKNDVNLMVRLSFSSKDATIDLSSKYGLLPQEAIRFITNATMQGYEIVGVCFHVGSQMKSNSQYLKALSTCRKMYDELETIGINLSILDIGGGFPYHANETFETLVDFFAPINSFIENNFCNIHCISEPGRFVSAPIATLVCSVIGKSYRNNTFNYYLNEGVYGCLSNKVFDFYDFEQMQIIPKQANTNKHKFSSTLYGPTCDSIDVLVKQYPLPEMQIGDTIVFENMGAYTIATVTNFNMLGSINTLIIE